MINNWTQWFQVSLLSVTMCWKIYWNHWVRLFINNDSLLYTVNKRLSQVPKLTLVVMYKVYFSGLYTSIITSVIWPFKLMPSNHEAIQQILLKGDCKFIKAILWTTITNLLTNFWLIENQRKKNFDWLKMISHLARAKQLFSIHLVK